MATASTAITSTPSSTGDNVSTLESQRLALPQPEGVEENPDHGLDRDTAEEVAGRYLDSTGPGGARRDGHLRQIGRDCLEDDGSAEPEAGSKQIVVLVSLMPANQITTVPARKKGPDERVTTGNRMRT
jgi:hypothetical protein